MESIKMNPEFYYNPQKLLSYNCLFNFIEGERGNGKTYAFKKFCIDNFIKKGLQFIWIRRYESELEDIEEFFSDIQNRYPNYELKVKGKKFYCNDKLMGRAMPLSKGITKKSVPFPNVAFIVFDEFLIEKGNYHYLPNEVKAFLDLYSTIARSRDVRVFFVANSISELNPYHLFFNIVPNGRFTKVKEDIILERTDTVNYRQAMKMTRFGKIINGTAYGRYAIDNEYINDNKEFIEEKTDYASNRFNILYNNVYMGIWVDTKVGKIYCSFKHNKTLPTYCITTNDMKPNYLILKSNSNYMKMLKTAFEFGYIYYENLKVKGYMQEVQKYLCIK